MKWTYDWLTEYLDTKMGPNDIADKLTEIGLEVDDVITDVPPIVAKIVECKPHANSDHLHVLKVNDGSDTLRSVVCGAPNARAGLVSALARPGCKIGDMEIKAGKIRGELSDGMMCSGKELGLNDDHSGIVELDEKTEVIGRPLSTFHFPLSTLFEAGITPNRPDYLGVRGIALDLAAAGAGKMKAERDKQKVEIKGNGGSRVAVIKNYDACPAYSLCEIKNIKMAPSNKVIASRLSAIGITPRNAPIDATNYVCHDMNQPMHCFDADEIKGDIVIRNAKNGEKFTDLFGAAHELSETDLVIADADGILALAGIVGGARGMTTDKTNNIILESAYFEPVGIRKTAKRLNLSTDASYRYERGTDPTTPILGIHMAAKMVCDACGGDVRLPYHDYDKNNPKLAFMEGMLSDTENHSEIDWINALDPRRIRYNPALFKQKTGIDLSAEKQKEILDSLGFGVKRNGDEWTVIPRPARVDIEIPENIVSELIRLYGYDNIKQNKVARPSNVSTRIPFVKKSLVSRGFFEIMNYGFGDSSKEKIVSSKESVRILNPIINTFDTVRNSLVQNMLDVIANNDRFRRSNLSLFELAPVFDGSNPGQQHDQLILARTGIFGDKIGIKHGAPTSIYDIREDLLSLFPNGIVQTDDNPHAWANPYRAGRILSDGKTVAVFAELHPLVAKQFQIKTNVVIGLVDDVSALTAPVDWRAAPQADGAKINLAEFPLITRDFAFAAPCDLPPTELIKIALSADNRIIETNVFDVFDLPDGAKSIAFEIVIQPTENMSDADLMAVQNAVINMVEKNTPAKIRDGAH